MITPLPHDVPSGSRRCLSGDANDAVASLSVAALAAPDDAEVANDLAAAYYERAERLGSAEDLPAALDAVERAVRLRPDLLEAWFNRALVLSTLQLRSEARTAWQEYLRRDPDSLWSAEASQRLAQIPISSREQWVDLEKRFHEASTAAIAQIAVSESPDKSRALVEGLLEKWSSAAARGDDSVELRNRLRALGEAFDRVQGELFHRDVIAAIDRAVLSGQGQALGAAHQQFFAARALLSANEFRRAVMAFDAAAQRLSRLASPMELRAKAESATAKHLLGEHVEALAQLTQVSTLAASRRYGVVGIRATWVSGMSEFGRGDLAAARRAYEQMLAAAQSTGDVEHLVTAHVLLANLHYVVGDNNAAWQHRVAAMARLDDSDAVATKTTALLSAAGHALAAGHDAAALLLQSPVLQSSQALNPVSEIQARTQRARTLVNLQDPAAARVELRAREAAVDGDPRCVAADKTGGRPLRSRVCSSPGVRSPGCIEGCRARSSHRSTDG